MKMLAGCGLCFLFLIPRTLLSDDLPSPHKIEFSEGGAKYYAIGAVDPHDATQFLGFKIFDEKGHLLQLLDSANLDLAYYGPNYTFNALHFDDFNFDGFPDVALPGDGSSPHMDYFDIWLWDPKRKRFVEDDALNDAMITRVDPKKKRLYAESSYHGLSSETAYAYLSGKLVRLYSDVIDLRKDSEVKTFYANGKVVRTVTSQPAPSN